MRDLIKNLVREEMEATRPVYTYATVASIDRNARRCTVIFPDSAEAVPVQMGSIQPQDVGQTVRIDGIAGDRYIADVMGPALIGNQTIEGTVTSVNTSGSLVSVSRDDGGGTVSNVRNGIGDMLKVNERVVIQRYRAGSSLQSLDWWVTQRSTITSAPWVGGFGAAPGVTVPRNFNSHYQNLYGGTYPSGYVIPASGAGTMTVQVNGRLTGLGQQEILFYPYNQLLVAGGATNYAWRNEDLASVAGAAGYARFQIVGHFAAFLSKGAIWQPQVRIEVGGGPPDAIINSITATFDWVSDDSRQFTPA